MRGVSTSRFSDEKIQLIEPSDTGNRPPLIYESGDDFLGQGELAGRIYHALGCGVATTILGFWDI